MRLLFILSTILVSVSLCLSLCLLFVVQFKGSLSLCLSLPAGHLISLSLSPKETVKTGRKLSLTSVRKGVLYVSSTC